MRPFRLILKKSLYIAILPLILSCSDEPQKLKVDRMKMDIEIVPEDHNGGYLISWNDSLCSEFGSDGDYLQKRPYELYCHIFSKEKDTLGYYRGLSSPRQFTYFQTKENTDSIIDLEFSIGINHFSEFLEEQSKDYIEKFNRLNKEQTLFKPIKLNLDTVIRKSIEIELIKINS